MGRLLGEFVDREARSVTAAHHQDLQVLLSERRAGWSVYGLASPDGEETPNFFDAWPDIARCFGIRPSTAKYKAIANLWDQLQALYCTSPTAGRGWAWGGGLSMQGRPGPGRRPGRR